MGEVRSKRIGGVAAALTACCLLLLVPSAFAAPPANDAFTNREVLSGSLPLQVSRTNAEATKEAGEFIPGLSPAGHSAWFEWEATSSGWMTIGACNSDFPLIVAIFTGAAVDELTQVVSGSAAQGPGCPNQQRQYTFHAQSGSKYEIAVDGNSFYAPPAAPPTTEGTFVLRIEATPSPSNDSFANASVLDAPVDEEPGGARFYFVNTNDNNWTATTEAGEPSHGTGAGASVWYSWTAPETATYNLVGPCCGSGLNWSLLRRLPRQSEPNPDGNGFGSSCSQWRHHLPDRRIRNAGSFDRRTVDGKLQLFDHREPATASFAAGVQRATPASAVHQDVAEHEYL